MTVFELRHFLSTQQQDLQVAYSCHSEQCLLEKNQIDLYEGCEPRPDGWIHAKRPDKPTQTYLLFPGS